MRTQHPRTHPHRHLHTGTCTHARTRSCHGAAVVVYPARAITAITRNTVARCKDGLARGHTGTRTRTHKTRTRTHAHAHVHPHTANLHGAYGRSDASTHVRVHACLHARKYSPARPPARLAARPPIRSCICPMGSKMYIHFGPHLENTECIKKCIYIR